jgi:hypothetical protein
MSDIKYFNLPDGTQKGSSFILARNKVTGFSRFSDSRALSIALTIGYRLIAQEIIEIAVFNDEARDVTHLYTFLLSSQFSTGTARDHGTHNNVSLGSPVRSLIITRNDPATEGKIFIFVWVASSLSYGIGRYKPEPGIEFTIGVDYGAVYLPTPEAVRLAGLFDFVNDDNKNILKEAGFDVPDEE